MPTQIFSILSGLYNLMDSLSSIDTASGDHVVAVGSRNETARVSDVGCTAKVVSASDDIALTGGAGVFLVPTDEKT